jgi:cation:H+ antiporter
MIALMCVLASPGLILRFLHVTGLMEIHLSVVTETSLFGLSIVASAFLLSWAAEAAEMDITQGLAVAFVALIAVLPEYAVDMSFAWKAGKDPAFAQYAVANMTGGNRLLIGAAWPMLVFILWARTGAKSLVLERSFSLEVLSLLVVAVYALHIPFKGSIELYDAVFLTAAFVVYMWLVSRVPSEEPELVGPARLIGGMPKTQRRISLATLFLYSAASILASAEPFAEGLIHSGSQLGINEFVLVQWVAPLASEAPEFLVAGILAWRGRASVGMGALLSSKVNQWTLLVGGLPVVYAISSGGLGGLQLDERQTEEVLLTAAQTMFAVAVVLSLSLSLWEAGALFVLFSITVYETNTEVRLFLSGVYLVLAAIMFVVQRREFPAIWRSARATLNEVEEEPEPAGKGGHH